MRRSWRNLGVGASLGLAALLAGCSAPEVTTAELSAVIERDGVAFTGQAIPEQVLDRLATNHVIVVGETHHLREHYEFIAALLRALHAHGFRQLLVEWPHMADWILEDYVSGGRLEPNWQPPISLGRPMFALIREFNASLPAAERVHVRAIDVNLDDYGGPDAFRDLLGALAGHLPSAGPVTVFLQADYGTPKTQTEAIESLRASLEAEESALIGAWGTDRYRNLVEMVEVELASIDIRADREDHYERSTRDRENAIKELADARIAGTANHTVINIGSTHAQKDRLIGTDLEWLGDYLVHRSTAIDGTITVVGVTSALTELEPGSSGTPFNVLDSSPPNELFRLMVETWPGRTVFLPLDDPVFTNGGVAVNYEETIYLSALKEQYDAVLQYGLAHRVPID
jgi:hypothetical protein